MSSERLYNLLPTVYRQRDADQGEPLRALLAVMEEELAAIEDDIDGLYDNWFIETCAEWVTPYIGDLLGVRGLNAISSAAISLRPYVANTLAYRRRKGTASVLQQLARDVTGWPARAVEFFELLETTQNVNHIRMANLRTPDLRDTNRLELLGGPFERGAHTADVRSIVQRRGKHNIPNIGLYLWRLQSYPIERGSAREITAPADPAPRWRFTFNPLGIDAPLFNQPQTEAAITDAVDEVNVPAPLRRRPLFDELEALRQGKPSDTSYFDPNPVLAVFLDGAASPIPPAQVQICNLSEWRRPTAAGIQVAADPVLGRLAFPAAVKPTTVQVSYSYGFSADLGGGPYNRFESASQALTARVTFQIGVSKNIAPVPNQIVATLTEAVQQWNLQPAGSAGVIAILDSRGYEESLTGTAKIQIPDGSQLLIVAADWPLVDVPGSLIPQQRLLGQFAPDERRPHLRGELSVVGATGDNPGRLALDGLLIEGGVRVLVGNLGTLRLAHCTVVPGAGGLGVNDSVTPAQQNSRLEITLDHCISGAITLPGTVARLTIADSIVDGAIAAPGTPVSIDRGTILGSATVRSTEASHSIFTAPLKVQRRQTGCVRFSFVPDGSRTPRCFRCQPQLALIDKTGAEIARTLARVTPSFTSERYGDPGYVQLSLTCADEIRLGGDDGAEMGVYNSLKQPQREANLRTSLDEYLRFGLDAGIFHAT